MHWLRKARRICVTGIKSKSGNRERSMIRVDGRDDSSSLIRVRGLNKTYSRGGEKIQVLQGPNLGVDKGDFVAFTGPSGSCTTTLLTLLGGHAVPSPAS